MKKNQRIKELKTHNLELQAKLNIALCDYDVWEPQYNDSKLESGYLKVRATDYQFLLKERLSVERYKEAMNSSHAAKNNAVTLLRETANLLGIDKHVSIFDIPNEVKRNIEVENRDNEHYEKNRESQLFTAEYYRRGEEIEKLNHSNVFWEKKHDDAIESLIAINLEKERFEECNNRLQSENDNLKAFHTSVKEVSESKTMDFADILHNIDWLVNFQKDTDDMGGIKTFKHLKAENKRLSNLLESNYLEGKNEDRPCTEKEKSFCADCGLVCRKKIVNK